MVVEVTIVLQLIEVCIKDVGFVRATYAKLTLMQWLLDKRFGWLNIQTLDYQ